MSNINLVTDKLTSLNLEKQLLGGIYKNPDVIYDLDSFVKETDFSNKLNETLYSILKQSILAGEQVDKVLWAQKYKNLSLNHRDEISPFEYIDAITFTTLNKKGTINTAKELVKLRIRRDIYNDAKEVQSFVLGAKSAEMTVAEMLAEVDEINSKRVNIITSDNEPVDLFAGIEDYLKELTKNPEKHLGLLTSFNQYNKWFSGLQSGDGAYVYSARLSEGKSVWMSCLGKGVAIKNQCKILYLDTEMGLKLNMDRAAAAQIGVNPYWLRHWNHNTDLSQKVLKSFNEFKKYNNLFFHMQVSNKNIKEILAIARKWKMKHVGRNEKALVILDYLKINGENTSESRSEWQTFGDWVAYLNDFGLNYNSVVAVAAQQNRSAIQDNGQRYDSDTTIGGSDRIGQYCRFAAIVRKKTFDEISEHGAKFGTHILVPVKYARDQGEQDYLSNGRVKVPTANGKSKIMPDYLNLTMENYEVKEAGTFSDVIKEQSYSKDLTDKDNKTKDNSAEF